MSRSLRPRPFPHRSLRLAASARRRLRPCLEALEDRITPSGTVFTPGVFTDNGTTDSFRGAIALANFDTGTATDTIQLQAGTYKLTIPNIEGKHDTANVSGDLNITNTSHALIIQGATDANGNPTTIIDQTDADRVFQIVNASTVTFKDLIIEGGQAQEDGGAGVAAGSTNAEGGGILDAGGNVTLSNVVLKNNLADGGTGLNAFGGGIDVANGGLLTIEDSTILANGALGGTGNTDATNFEGGGALGGGVYAIGPTTIANSKVSDNVVTGGNANSFEGTGGNASGGGVFALGPITLTNSTLDGNTVTGGSSSVNSGGGAEGGGLCVGEGTATIINSTLSDNTLTGGNGSLGNNVIFTRGPGDLASPQILGDDVGGDAAGGGVIAAGTLNISASTLSGNTLTGGKGILNDSSASFQGDVGGEVFGGGVYANGLTGINTSTLSGNTLTAGKGDYTSGTVGGSIGGSASGGGVYFNPLGTTATLALTASTLSGNTVAGGAGSAFGGAATPGLAQGGAAYIAGADNKLVNSTIADNQAIGGLGIAINPVASGGGLFFALKTTATLTNDTVADNKTSLPQGGDGDTNGGGIDNAGGTVTLVNTLVAQNSASVNNGPDYFGTVANSDHNLIGNADESSGFSAAHGDLLGSTANPLNPQLAALANNGGPTPTLALLPGSPAINAGDNSAQAVTGPFDQRGQGFARVQSGTIDIGAFEVQVPPIHLPPPGLGPPPTLHVPFLLGFLDGLLGGVETGNGNGTWSVIDRIFGFPLFVSTYDGAGNLMSVTVFGINLTPLFKLL